MLRDAVSPTWVEASESGKRRQRRLAKNELSKAPHSGARTPALISVVWLSRGSAAKL